MERPAGWITAAAERLAAARLARAPVPELSPACRPVSEDDAYAVQDEVHRQLTAAGRGEIVGVKVGCTTAVMQRYLAISHPCAGGVFAPTVSVGAAACQASDFVRLGVECEIAVRLKSDLHAPRRGEFTRSDVAAAVGSCLAAIELVDDRYADYRALGAATLIADDFFGAGCVLGAEIADFPPDLLDTVSGRMVVNGAEVGRGAGRDVLGHPLESLRWLATSAARRGRPLRAGMIVLLGSMTEPQWLRPGDAAQVVADPLGTVSADLR